MSIYATNWAYNQKLKKPGAKFTLVALADYADPGGFCYPSQETLATRTGQGERTVRAHLKELEDGGYLKRKHRYVNGQRTTDGYYLLAPPEALSPLAEAKTYRRDSPLDYRRNSPLAKSASDPLIDKDDPSVCVEAQQDTRAGDAKREKPKAAVSDSALAHPAVRLFVELMERTPNRAQRDEIAAKVTDLALFKRVLRDLLLEGKEDSPLVVTWALERYNNNGVRPAAAVGGAVVTPLKTAAERSAEAQRRWEERGGSHARTNA